LTNFRQVPWELVIGAGRAPGMLSYPHGSLRCALLRVRNIPPSIKSENKYPA